ncbi:hypothetical protein MEN41_13190 [Dolichospermum sp. ST_con]|nr:hypothetical protein [Dolichospermum sp. ST_con]MDD1418279.1 hypothetical protein [Dolichospermum sp. ST_sed1]MDD1423169.1 hypothetical protein [Dolichospermum sp. ST_sed9]MDD1429527.1 hypothetical protein [Dolichospermum sp. ST_sed6]MDD1436727.1 hypothetical protein [Dolichospermum sp. ST_sed10]MDD1438903.1 hypothetical protein [Dolichospermum sp. ST_sed3]MDD1449569.1 hypothetical protein [Dolichospermum sp. ST_sed8]MDD1453402.1 hypothetical protein [Dolichospermum sp. ST_sed7]MDD145889
MVIVEKFIRSLFQTLQKRSHTTNFKRAFPIPKSDRSPNILKKRFLRSASLSHPHIPKSDRTPKIQKRSHFQTSKQRLLFTYFN